MKLYIFLAENNKITRAKENPFLNCIEVDSEVSVDEVIDMGIYLPDVKKVICNLDVLRDKSIHELKEECSKRIRSYSGADISNTEWLFKSQNFQDIRATYLSEQGAINNGVNGVKLTYTKEQYDEATRVITRKEELRKQYRAIKKLLQSMDISELQAFNPTDGKYW